MLLFLGCKESEGSLEDECKEFLFPGPLKGEKADIQFILRVIHADYLEYKAWEVLHKLCGGYIDNFTVDLRI